jgi:hypothetical protein
MGIGAFDYKIDWTEQTPIFDGMIALTSAGHFLGRAMMAERAARRRIKTDPRLWSLAMTLRGRWTSLVGSGAGRDRASLRQRMPKSAVMTASSPALSVARCRQTVSARVARWKG